MKLIAREPTAEMSAVGGQYLGIGMLGDYELADTEIARLRAEVDYLRELLREARDSVNEELNHAEINRRQESIDYSRDLLAKIDAAIVKEN